MLEARHDQVTSAPGQPAWSAHFFHGIFEEALRRTNVVPQSSTRIDADSGVYVIDLRWPEKQ